MKPSKPTASFALAIPALLLLSPTGESPEFAPEEGTELTKVFEIRWDFELNDLSVVVNGQDFSGMTETFEVSVETEMKLRVSDTYDEVAGGRPHRLLRFFDELHGSTSFRFGSDVASEDQEVCSSSELEGRTVLFEWDPDEEEYSLSYEDDGGDSDLLEGLREDMDLRIFLPGEAVSQGDSWEVDTHSFASLMMPGGNVRLIPEDMGTDDQDILEGVMDESFLEEFEDVYDGTCTCTFETVREEEAGPLAEIRVVIEISSSVDLSELLANVFESIGEEVGGDMPGITIDAADLTLDYEGEGVLLWNLEANRLHSFELLGEAEMGIDLSLSADVEGQSFTAELSAEVSGSMEQTVEAEE